MKMPFGKYGPKKGTNEEGTEISDLPIEYLEWAAENFTEGLLLNEIRKELKRRREPEKGVTARLPKQVFMEKLAALLMECPDEFLYNLWNLDTPRGRFVFKLRNLDANDQKID